jgi:RsiW-degrading membrane proteinase PrsW (M82 family)
MAYVGLAVLRRQIWDKKDLQWHKRNYLLNVIHVICYIFYMVHILQLFWCHNILKM